MSLFPTCSFTSVPAICAPLLVKTRFEASPSSICACASTFTSASLRASARMEVTSPSMSESDAEATSTPIIRSFFISSEVRERAISRASARACSSSLVSSCCSCFAFSCMSLRYSLKLSMTVCAFVSTEEFLSYCTCPTFSKASS